MITPKSVNFLTKGMSSPLHLTSKLLAARIFVLSSSNFGASAKIDLLEFNLMKQKSLKKL